MKQSAYHYLKVIQRGVNSTVMYFRSKLHVWWSSSRERVAIKRSTVERVNYKHMATAVGFQSAFNMKTVVSSLLLLLLKLILVILNLHFDPMNLILPNRLA